MIVRPFVVALFCSFAASVTACGDDADDSPVSDDTAEADTAEADAGSDVGPQDEVSDGDTSQPGPDTTAPPAFLTPPAGPSDMLFPPDRVIEVDITLSDDDWQALLGQTRTLVDVIGPGCLDGPVDSPFTWFSADVTVDGVERRNVGLRKKGFIGSLSATRPSLKIKFDEYVDDAELHGLDRLTLNNGRQDPSRMNTCMSYDLYRAAGMPAPRCTFAHVTVNGENLGLYANVETVKKRFLRRHFPEPLGALWEGQLSDFTDDWLTTFDRKIGPESSNSALARLTTALEAADADLLPKLSAVLDVEHFLRFWAAEVLIAHWDGYNGNRNNFYVYHDESRDKLVFMPWGADATFDDRGGQGGPASVVASSLLSYRLYNHPVGRALYLDALQDLLDTVWDEPKLLAKVDAWDVFTASSRMPNTDDDAAASIQRIRLYINQLRPALDSELDGLPVQWPNEPGERPCFDSEGSIQGTLSTTWGTLFEDNFFMTGDGELTFVPTDPDNAPIRWGAKAGAVPDEPGIGHIQFGAQLAVGGFLFFDLSIPLSLFETGTTVSLGASQTGGIVYFVSEEQNVSLLGLVSKGTISFEAAGTEPGDPIVLTIDSPVFGAWE